MLSKRLYVTDAKCTVFGVLVVMHTIASCHACLSNSLKPKQSNNNKGFFRHD